MVYRLMVYWPIKVRTRSRSHLDLPAAHPLQREKYKSTGYPSQLLIQPPPATSNVQVQTNPRLLANSLPANDLPADGLLANNLPASSLPADK